MEVHGGGVLVCDDVMASGLWQWRVWWWCLAVEGVVGVFGSGGCGGGVWQWMCVGVVFGSGCVWWWWLAADVCGGGGWQWMWVVNRTERQGKLYTPSCDC